MLLVFVAAESSCLCGCCFCCHVVLLPVAAASAAHGQNRGDETETEEGEELWCLGSLLVAVQREEEVRREAVGLGRGPEQRIEMGFATDAGQGGEELGLVEGGAHGHGHWKLGEEGRSIEIHGDFETHL